MGVVFNYVLLVLFAPFLKEAMIEACTRALVWLIFEAVHKAFTSTPFF